MIPFPVPDLFELLRECATPERPIYLVGGAVRDRLLGKTAHDLDFCMAGDPIAVARRAANQLGVAFYVLDDERSTARIIFIQGSERFSIDFAAFRGPDLEADLRGRDFTINALAVSLADSGRLIDPLHGAADLRSGLLRACGPRSFEEDPLRVLRGVRLSTSLGFHIEEQTRQWMRAAAKKLGRTSAERRRDELFRILDGPQPATAMRLLDWLEAIPALLPELDNLKGVSQSTPHIRDVWDHTLAALDQYNLLLAVLAGDRDCESRQANVMLGQASLRLGRFRQNLASHMAHGLNPNRTLKSLVMFVLLYHDIAKPITREVDPKGRIRNLGHEKLGAEAAARRAKALQLTNAECDRVRTIIRHHMRVHSLVQTGSPPTPRAVYRFFRDTGAAGVDVILHSLADTLATYGPTLPVDTWEAYLDASRMLLESWWERREETVQPPALLNGHDLQQELGLRPGPRLGLALEAVREAQATGQVSTREEALRFVQAWMKDAGKKYGL